MSPVTDLDPGTAHGWIDRWERQQEVYMPTREDRFTALIDAVEAGSGRPDPLVLDLGCGPGSLAVRLLGRLPRAAVVAVDADPVTLRLGQAAYGSLAGLAFADGDLRADAWADSLPLPAGRALDAVVSTTALHWLSGDELRALYGRLATLIRPGGLFLDGDHLREDEAANPVLAGLERARDERQAGRRPSPGDTGPAGHTGTARATEAAESWEQWWQAAASDAALAPAVAERAARGLGASDHTTRDGMRLETHLSALRAAGFAEAGILWQDGSSRVLCGVR